MTKQFQFAAKAIFVLASILAMPVASSAQLRVITSGGFATPFAKIVPEFEKATGITVTTIRGKSQGGGPDTVSAQLRRGVPVDVVIMSREGLNDLIADGKIVAKSDVDLAQTPLGVSVRAGAPKPDISTVEAFKQSLLHAKSITFPDSTTGIYMATKMFPKLGIASAISGKVTNIGVAAVGKGEAEIAIQPVSELIDQPGVDFVGTIPNDIQYVSVFGAAMVEGSKGSESSKRLLEFLKSEIAAAIIKKSGMEPPKTRY